MEWIQVDNGLRDPVAGHSQVRGGPVQTDRLYPGRPGRVEGVEEAVEGLLAAVLAGPHHPAGVVIGLRELLTMTGQATASRRIP
jgi:hypothetical protein